MIYGPWICSVPIKIMMTKSEAAAAYLPLLSFTLLSKKRPEGVEKLRDGDGRGSLQAQRRPKVSSNQLWSEGKSMIAILMRSFFLSKHGLNLLVYTWFIIKPCFSHYIQNCRLCSNCLLQTRIKLKTAILVCHTGCKL